MISSEGQSAVPSCLTLSMDTRSTPSHSSSSSGIVAQLFVVPVSNEVTRESGVPRRGTTGERSGKEEKSP